MIRFFFRRTFSSSAPVFSLDASFVSSSAPLTGAESTTWTSLGLPSFLHGKLLKQDIAAPTPIQIAAIGPLITDLSRPPRDALIHSETGSGKTLAYLLPLLARLEPKTVPDARLRAIVCVPTRELAYQVAEVAEELGAVGKRKDQTRTVRVLRVVGEVSAHTLHVLKTTPPHVLVGTPATLMRLIPAHVNTGELTALVLDEADELLRVHNVPATRAVVAAARAHGNRPGIICVSATSSFSLEKFARETLRAPLVADMTGGAMATPATLRHVLVRFPRGNAVFNTFTRMLAALRPAAVLSFHNSATGLEALEAHLRAKGVRVGVLGAAYAGAQRARALEGVATGAVQVLLATEMAARGLDVPRLSHVVNFDPPSSLREYVHRAGRVGRLSSKTPGRAGTVVNFVGSDAGAAGVLEMATELGVALDEVTFDMGEPVTHRLLAGAADVAEHRRALREGATKLRLRSPGGAGAAQIIRQSSL
jgi:ATP-dependent RNA helicase DeaD